MEVIFNNFDFIVFGNELDIVRIGNVECVINFLCGNFNFLDSFGIEVLRGKYECSIIRVNISVFDVFGDVVYYYFIIFGDGVYFNFFGFFDVFGDNDGVVLGNVGSLSKVVVEVILRENDIYCCIR